MEYQQKIIPENFSSQGKLEHAGTKKVIYENRELHPVETMQKNQFENAERAKLA